MGFESPLYRNAPIGYKCIVTASGRFIRYYHNIDLRRGRERGRLPVCPARNTGRGFS